MHAVVVTEPGDVDALSWAEVPDPTPGDGEVVIDVAASAVNRADLLQRQGFYPAPPGGAGVMGRGGGAARGGSGAGARGGGRRAYLTGQWATRSARRGRGAPTPSRSRCRPGS